MAPSKPATAPRTGGKGSPPVAVTQVELEETEFTGDGCDYGEDMSYGPGEYVEEEYGPADPAEYEQ